MMEKVELAPGFSISRLIKGGWQLSQGHGGQVNTNPVEDMFAFADAGITTFDCADIYTGVEEMIGRFLTLRKRRLGHHSDIRVLTKLVPDYEALPTINKNYVQRIIDRSLKRLNLERLDMVQYSWWSYDIPGWIETGHWLMELQKEGKIELISATNFNTFHTREIIEAGINLSTVQVQYSLLDQRPEKGLVELCAHHHVHLLCFGTLAGGFFSEQWLDVDEPKAPLANRSLVKYKLMIDEFGGWDLFQSLLFTLDKIAKSYRVGIANVASRYMLDRKQVAAVIIGAANAKHLEANMKTFDFALNERDVAAIDKILSQRKWQEGDVFDAERVKDGAHGRIMKYNLNSVKANG